MTVYDLAAELPSINQLRHRCQALAVLEQILGSEEPYYAYTTAWGEDEAALMSNGGGDEWAIVFTADGAFIRVFDHESPMSPFGNEDHELWPGILDGLPTEFQPQVEEPAFGDEDGQFVATAVLWRLASDDRWRAGASITFPTLRSPWVKTGPDGSGMLSILLNDIVDRYIAFATDNYEREIDRTAVEHIIAHRPLTEAVVRALNPEASLQQINDEILETGYPSPQPHRTGSTKPHAPN